MTPTLSPLPDFKNPPVGEVALSVQFDRLTSLRSVHLVRLWLERFKERFPKTEEHAPLEPTVEKFGVMRATKFMLKLEALDRPPVPRYWFVNDAETDLIQVQQDRFVRNWRKSGDGDTYPRYEYVSEMFRRDFSVFQDFLRTNDVGACVPKQCEVTYVNTIEPGSEWREHGQLSRVIQPWSGQNSDGFLPTPDDVTINARYIIPSPDDSGEPAGRLIANVQPGYRRSDDAPIVQLHMIARGRPLGDGADGVSRFFDLGREWIVRGFASFTTKAMHATWERQDVR